VCVCERENQKVQAIPGKGGGELSHQHDRQLLEHLHPLGQVPSLLPVLNGTKLKS
jgi:hypothetical protein